MSAFKCRRKADRMNLGRKNVYKSKRGMEGTMQDSKEEAHVELEKAGSSK